MNNDFILTTCPFCGCGCNFYLAVADGKVAGVEPCLEDRVSRGKLCVKGLKAYAFVHHEDRLTKPLIRKEGTLQEVSWDEALDFIVQQMKAIKGTHSADAIGMLSSAKCTNEENYLFMKLGRAVIGTNNIDHCARL